MNKGLYLVIIAAMFSTLGCASSVSPDFSLDGGGLDASDSDGKVDGDGDEIPGDGGAGTENIGGDGGSVGDTDQSTDSDAGTNPDGGTSGWNSSDNGTVEVQDGGVVITEADGTKVVCYETLCDGRLLECGDCKDNDGDGHVDWRDRECLGPCDNTEGPALISGVGGVTGSTCHVDCYFDYGNGMGTGSDDCWWDHQCDPLEPEKEICEYDSKKAKNEQFCPSTQSELCEEVCIPFTPNGCDCFGCCTFPELSGSYVWIGAKDSLNNGTCTFDTITDPTKCPPCTPVSACMNTCERCELCIGKTELPADCFAGSDGDSDVDGDGDVDGDTDVDGDSDTDNVPAIGQCPEGITPCGLPGLDPCDPGYYCISGCCQFVPVV